jgi:hypothetical protein
MVKQELEGWTVQKPLCPYHTRSDLGLHPGYRGEKPATNDLSYGMAVSLMTHACYMPKQLIDINSISLIMSGDEHIL